MGTSTSKINDNYNLYNEEMVDVYFCQLRQLPESTTTPQQLNALLGLNIPKYSAFEDTFYPYVFCISVLIDIHKIAQEYGYKIGFISKHKVLKSEFNANYEVAYSLNSGYKLSV